MVARPGWLRLVSSMQIGLDEGRNGDWRVPGLIVLAINVFPW